VKLCLLLNLQVVQAHVPMIRFRKGASNRGKVRYSKGGDPPLDATTFGKEISD
jgi:hypothetical protein